MGGVGLAEPTGPCKTGYYCPKGSTHQDEAECPRGNYCPQGSGSPVQCPTGSYQPAFGSASCLKCPAGSYCSDTGLVHPSGLCTADHFCPEDPWVLPETPKPKLTKF